MNYSLLHRLSNDIPDTLLLIVCIITVFASVCYMTRRKTGIFDNKTLLFRLIMYAVPVAYLVKTLLKYVFGRITTREWLIRPDLYGFHWFRGVGYYGGFPSGHMMVFTALAMILWRFYPMYRVAYASFLTVLGFSLVATDYHFLSDVIAGAYCGAIVEICTYEVLKRREWKR
ncbi:MAG TPA: phosphatase PAP2 family protein [Geobacteraceae bacterium]|nr:phosphatase PAP2 family protein [Geobacteraceae bacterium]